MDCPKCNNGLQRISYEGVEIESCTHCAGEWLDHDELLKISDLRKVKFSPEELEAVGASATITSRRITIENHEHICPKDGNPTEPIQYGGDSGIILDRCTACGGFWMDDSELEKVQAVIERWEDLLPQDLQRYSPMLHQIEAKIDREDDVTVSRLPLIGGLINACVNGALDLLD
jgi:Zn-finger nucleic acid-binding protein